MHRTSTKTSATKSPARDPVALVAVALAAVALAAVASWSPAFAQGSGPVSVATASSDEYGTYLVDGDGHALYLFVKETEGESGAEQARAAMTSGVRDASPSCQDACAGVWPPLAAASVTAGDGVDGSMLYTTDVHGVTQVVYDGWPLYTYAGDDATGDTKGEGIEPPDASAFGGSWYLVAPDGSAIEREGGDG